MVNLKDGQQAARPPPWHASAAYLYVLHLDGPALAWEYLRRHPGYRQAWHTRLTPRSPGACAHWKTRRWMRAKRCPTGSTLGPAPFA